MLYNDNPRTIKDFDENKKGTKKRSREGNFGGQAENANRGTKAEAIEGKRQKRRD